jgi:hypothetical protein
MDRRLARFLIAGVVLALVTGGILSLFASSQPDGMERVAIDKGFEETATAHPLSGSPLADYQMAGVGNSHLATTLAGVAGVAVTGALACGLLYGARRLRRRPVR